MQIPQHFSKDFMWWYYDWKTAEDIIVLKDGAKDFKKIHIFDPMWLINCSLEDIIMLYYNLIYCEAKDSEQASKYQRVVFLCFAWDVNVGCDFDKKLGKFVKVQEVKKKKPKQAYEQADGPRTKTQAIQAIVEGEFVDAYNATNAIGLRITNILSTVERSNEER